MSNAGAGALSPHGRFLLSTFGSLGDLYPYLAVGLGLKARGHEAIVATSAGYEETVSRLGLGFRAIRPDLPDPAQMPVGQIQAPMPEQSVPHRTIEQAL